jgi:ABC-type transporter lipoprotein component MlaA
MRFAIPLLMLSLTTCSSVPVVTAVETFCTRVERYHATEAERAFLKANSGPLERFIRWAAAINKQYDDNCLKPVAGP